MNKITTEVNILEFRRLLFELKDFSPQTCIRFRLIGEMWQPNHLRILRLTEKGISLLDQSQNKLLFIQDLQSVMQFELDGSFQHYQPNFHYSVRM
jgi:hypothetical protein